MILVNKGKGNDFWIDENGIMRSRDLRTIFWWSSTNKDSTFMDLVSGLPRTPSTYEVVWVIMDERTRFVYFVPYRTNCSIVAIIRVRIGSLMWYSSFMRVRLDRVQRLNAGRR